MSLSDLPHRRRQNRTFPTHSGPRPKRRTGVTQVSTWVTAEVDDYLRERAAYAGIPLGTLIRDVLSVWTDLCIQDERLNGMLDLDKPEMVVPDREPGYRDSLYPKGHEISHLDSSPLGIEEL